MSYKEEMEKVRQLALLCLETRELMDEEIDQIIRQKEEICRYLDGCNRFASSGAEKVRRYRRRKLQLDKLSTEELKEQMREMNRGRGEIFAADENDELDDSFFEAPPIDSDEHIIYELLEERKTKTQAASVST